MIRVVLDTNVLISALLSQNGSPAQVFLMLFRDSDFQLCVSGDVFAEYEEVIRRPRFQRSDSEIDAMLGAIRTEAIWVKPTEIVHGCADPDGDIFLECVEASVAHYLVTGNTKHFPSSWGMTRVVTAREFLDLLH